jgi:hypothetical protein
VEARDGEAAPEAAAAVTAILVVVGGRREVAILPAALLVYRDGGRSKLREEGRCRLCLRPYWKRPMTRHHLVPKRIFRLYGIQSIIRDADANIVPLCSPCHAWVEQPDPEGRRMLRKVLGAAEATFVIRLCGADWFERRYPSSADQSRRRD